MLEKVFPDQDIETRITSIRNLVLSIFLKKLANESFPYNSMMEDIASVIRLCFQSKIIVGIELDETFLDGYCESFVRIIELVNKNGLKLSDVDLIRSAVLSYQIKHFYKATVLIPSLINELRTFIDFPNDEYKLPSRFKILIGHMQSLTRDYQQLVENSFIYPYMKLNQIPTKEDLVRANLRKYTHSFDNTLHFLTLGGMIDTYIFLKDSASLAKLQSYLTFLKFFFGGFDVVADSLEVVGEITPVVAYLAQEAINSQYRNFRTLLNGVGIDFKDQGVALDKLFDCLQNYLSDLPAPLPGVVLTSQIVAKLANILSELARNSAKYCDPSGLTTKFEVLQNTDGVHGFRIILSNRRTVIPKIFFVSSGLGTNIITEFIREINNIALYTLIEVKRPVDPASDPYKVSITIFAPNPARVDSNQSKLA